MSLTCSDVRVSDRTESPSAPRTAHVADVARRCGTSGIVGAKSHNGLQATAIALLPLLQGKEVRWSSPTSSRGRQMVTAQVQVRRKANILPHSAFGLASPDDKPKSRLQVLLLLYHSIPSDRSRTDSSATAAGTSTAALSAGTTMNLTKRRSQGTVNHNRAAN
jgi:hypothetical protein